MEERIIQAISDLENKMDERFSAMDERFSAMDERFSAMDERFSAMDERFSKLEEDHDKLDKKVNEQHAKIMRMFGNKETGFSDMLDQISRIEEIVLKLLNGHAG